MSIPEIAALDAALERAGEDVTLTRTVKRGGGTVVSSVVCRAAVRSVSAEQIAGTITLNDLTVVIGPTEILAAGWPGTDDAVPGGSTVDQRLPKTTDSMVVQGRARQVKVSKPVFVGGVWVRTDLVVAG
jgi:hypothetical protein